MRNTALNRRANIAAVPIATDLLCIRCGYNLRGLTFNHDCPECNLPAVRTLEAQPRSSPDKLKLLAAIDRIPFQDAAEKAGYPIDALYFLADVMDFSSARIDIPADVSALSGVPRLVAEFRDFSLQCFPDEAEAIATLQTWKLATSADLGKVLHALHDFELIQLNPSELAATFDGLFSIEELFNGCETAFTGGTRADITPDTPTPPLPAANPGRQPWMG
jgi:hypothetical protein